jgi:hypothetical protein
MNLNIPFDFIHVLLIKRGTLPKINIFPNILYFYYLFHERIEIKL